MISYDRKAGFVKYEKIKVSDTREHNKFDLFIDAAQDITFQSHEDLYIPCGIKKADYILYLLYDIELTWDATLHRPSLVLYTDFYFKAYNKGFSK